MAALAAATYRAHPIGANAPPPQGGDDEPMSERSTGRPVPDGAAIGERAGGTATGHRDVTGAFILLGSPAYRRAAAAMGASGFATFALLYCVQPLMPLFSAAFRVTPAVSSLSLSVATAVMTVSIFAAGILSSGSDART